MSELVYRDVIPSVGGNQFFYARILGCSHVGGVWGGSTQNIIQDVMTTDRQKYSTYAWEEVIPNQTGNRVVWSKGNRSSYSYYDASYGQIEPGEVEEYLHPETGEVTVRWDPNTIPDGPQTGLHSSIDTLNDYFIDENIEVNGKTPDAKFRDRSLYREFVDEEIERINDLSPEYDANSVEGIPSIPPTDPNDPNYSVDYYGDYTGFNTPEGGSDWWFDSMDPNDPQPIPESVQEPSKILFGGVLAMNISEYNRYHNPASCVGSIVLMQEIIDGDSPKYYFNAPETRSSVLAKIIRAHPIGPTMPNVDPDEDPEYRMWAYEWREVEFNIMPNLSESVVAQQHNMFDDARGLHPTNRDRDITVVGADYPIRDGGDYRVGGKTLSEEPLITLGGYTANSDVEHWVSSRLATGGVKQFDQPVFNLVKEKGLFKETILRKIKELFIDPDSDDLDYQKKIKDEKRSFVQNEIAMLKKGVFGGNYRSLGSIDTGGPTGDLDEDDAEYNLTEDDITLIDKYLTEVDLPRTNPLALNTCEFLNVSTDNQYIDTGIRGETGDRKLVPRYVSPGVDMSRLPRFMRVQPIRPGSVVVMNFPSTSFYIEPSITYSEGSPYSGVPIPLQNRPNQNPPMFTCPNAIDTLDDPCAYKQLPFPFKLENVNEQFINTVQPLQGSYIVDDGTIQPLP